MGFLFDKMAEQKEKQINKDNSKLGEYSIDSDKEEIKELRNLLNEEETCNLIISGFSFNRRWIISITNFRMIFIRKKINKEIEKKIFFLDDLDKVIVKKGMVMSKVDMELDNENILIENISNIFLNTFLKYIKKEYISKKEDEINKKNELEKEKQKEFKKIMDSNPEVTSKRDIEIKVEPKLSKRQEEKQYQKDRLKQLKREHVPYCPKCKSTSLTYQNKKLSVGRAVAGGFIMGPVGAAVGGMTSKKGYVKCLNCGHKWKI
ncbi:PH domain-containing protein [Clostridium sardiniense]|uniref:PH domain-containing protein n=1 Tax=Clostridium sardiniense TaxID=29369 RepID=UPI0019563C69|nr:PH domain-containing protein [Clostridium sardiniense]MBM7835963.1 hypothetical protein [Clostridium sardiniense]